MQVVIPLSRRKEPAVASNGSGTRIAVRRLIVTIRRGPMSCPHVMDITVRIVLTRPARPRYWKGFSRAAPSSSTKGNHD